MPAATPARGRGDQKRCRCRGRIEWPDIIIIIIVIIKLAELAVMSRARGPVGLEMTYLARGSGGDDLEVRTACCELNFVHR